MRGKDSFIDMHRTDWTLSLHCRARSRDEVPPTDTSFARFHLCPSNLT